MAGSKKARLFASRISIMPPQEKLHNSTQDISYMQYGIEPSSSKQMIALMMRYFHP